MDPEGNMAWFEGLSGKGMKPGLENITELLRLLGNPQNDTRYIHVAGTDGKGSVCAMIDSILRASGYNVGCFTSPHIMAINECIRIDGKDISDGDLLHLISVVRPHVESLVDKGVECTSFEVLTAMALEFFSRVQVDIAVIEVGMGGRLDSTNVVKPLVTVINNIGLEHMAYLGSTLQEIASEKAGIMKPGIPCITMNGDEAFSIIHAKSEEIGCPLLRIYPDSVQVMDSKPDSIDMVFRDEIYTISIPGRHQANNAALAIAAVSMLPDYHDVIEDHISEGLESVSWPCRMQKMIAMPLIVDVTHTKTGAECLARDISEVYGKVVLVLGMLSDKDADGVCRALSAVSDKVIITSPDSKRAMDAGDLAEVMARYKTPTMCRTIDEAMDKAMEVRGDYNILATGSFRTAEGVLRWVQRKSA